ncbi:MAG: ABC transporter permease [Pseudanabaenaceae cyanobacterium]
MQVSRTLIPPVGLMGVFFGTIVLLVALPVLVVLLGGVFTDTGATWAHLMETVLKSYVLNTLWLALGVTVGVVIIGTATGWLVAMCDFWGRSWFSWLLLLPLAAPAYLLAYIYTDFLEYFGLFQRFLRWLFGWQSASDYWFPQVRNLGGAIVMLVLALYPYVYLLARVAFSQQSAVIIEASRNLGCNPWRSFVQVALPLARPAIVAGTALAVMETLNDIGTVEFFGVSTLSTGIYRTWFSLGDKPAAMQLAALLTLFALLVILIEQWSRGRMRFYQHLGKSPQRYKLGWGRGAIAFLVCGIPTVLGFFLPLGLMIYMCINVFMAGGSTLDADLLELPQVVTWDQDLIELGKNSLLLAIWAALVGGLLSLLLAYWQRTFHNRFTELAVRLSVMGYGIPGAVIAVGIMIPLGYIDQRLNEWLDTGLIFSGTIFALIYAYNIRFLAVAFNSVESSLAKVRPNLDEASRSLGEGIMGTLWRIHTPLVSGGVVAGMIFLFVDTLKELSATVVIRPFNFETLAVRVYTFAADERLYEAALPALAILVAGILPIFWLSRQISQQDRCTWDLR